MNKKLPPWLWVILAIFFMSALSRVGGTIEQKRAPSQVVVVETPPKPTPQPTPDLSDGLTLEERNAYKKAQSYLSHLAYSESGLLKQLDYEGFTPEQARFGVDHSDADWFAEAAEKAASYMEHLAYSRDGLYRQLEYEGFTPDQIEFALADVGY